jgi:hypothetical protein
VGRLYTVYLAFRNSPQSFDYAHLRLYIRRLIQESHNNLNHLRSGLFELAMFLREQQNLFVQHTPVARILTYCDDGNE